MATVSAQRLRAAPAQQRKARCLSRVPRVAVRASALQSGAQEDAPLAARREVLAGLAGASIALPALNFAPAAWAADGEYATFLGYATPPTSYGGYGGNANEAPRYTFEYPANWKPDQPNKVEKGTQGIDGRVVNPRSKGQRAFVITLTRAGEDNKSFRLTDIDATLAGFAGADYDLQDALSSSTARNTSSREVGGETLYDYDIESPEFHYLVTITVSQGKIFGIFVRSPTKAFAADAEKLRHIVSTFRLL